MDGEKVRIWTDGSCAPNPGKGGWAAYLVLGEYKRLVVGNSGDEECTNNRAELMAMIIALETLKRPCAVVLVSDSQYAVGVASGKWNPSSNLDLIERLHGVSLVHKVTWTWKREFSTPEQTIVHEAAERQSGGVL